jgi:hypothetical protein
MHPSVGTSSGGDPDRVSEATRQGRLEGALDGGPTTRLRRALNGPTRIASAAIAERQAQSA